MPSNIHAGVVSRPPAIIVTHIDLISSEALSAYWCILTCDRYELLTVCQLAVWILQNVACNT